MSPAVEYKPNDAALQHLTCSQSAAKQKCKDRLSTYLIVARLSRQSSWAKLMNHILPFDGCNYAAIP
ncbi:MAG: hypothetical protein AAGU16_09120, partial [Desulfitobacterium hafniense]